MGATSKQGWYLFLFIVGFTLGPAGLFALGWPIALLGFAMIAGALAGFHSIKEGAASSAPGQERGTLAHVAGVRAR